MFCRMCGAKTILSNTVKRYDISTGAVSYDIDIYKCPDNHSHPMIFIVSDHVKSKHYPISPSKFFSEEWGGRWFELLPDKEQ